MSLIDIFTVCSFIGVILCGVMALVVMDMRNSSRTPRIRTTHAESCGSVTVGKSTVNLNRTCSPSKNRQPIQRLDSTKVSRLRTVAGAKRHPLRHCGNDMADWLRFS